ncbi:calcium/potassium channel (CAKC), putative [Trypanosoma equiperdum]|uniref:Calcium/potassium channel (CAKC), putative n=2 Tax=Trypanozoon TaxID=39700 RepID=Q38F65_TRYB2|nr:calcium/potassium channel CAKC [Trypanosoma brucei brucei TREU927]EAN76555.1 calcium/potassium channel (CAKC), putative [Trypanosoma brucei brucei TREU927]SCU68332.1 calcium/potassium channel (CAKC), putative [Trypanosoma equiperdum]
MSKSRAVVKFGGDQSKERVSFRNFFDVLNQRHSNVSVSGLAVTLLFELLSISIYVEASFYAHPTSIYDFNWKTGRFITVAIINAIFFSEWIVMLWVEEQKVRYCLSLLSIVNALTCLPMVIVGIGAIVKPTWQSVWVPLFLRVWWLRKCILVLLDYPQVAKWMMDIRRDICRFLITMLAVLSTCVGIQQFVETLAGNYMDPFSSLYCMVTTFGTIGYGDVSPQTAPGRFLMIGFLVVALSYFLPLFQRLAQIGRDHLNYNECHSCWGRRPHVIFSGIFTGLGAEIILMNFYAGWRKYLGVRVVLLSPVDFPPEVRLLADIPWLRNRVVLMIGDSAKQVDLIRADAANAEAIFLFGDTGSAAYHADYQVIQQSLAIRQFDPELPQHLYLRSERHTRHVASYAASVVEVERLLHHLLGLGAAVPGAVPLIMNLLRTYEPLKVKGTASRPWIEEYEWSLQNDIHCLEMQQTFRGYSFHSLARLLLQHNVTPIGIIDENGEVQLNPHRISSSAVKLVVVAKALRSARSALEAAEEAHSQTSFGEHTGEVEGKEPCIYGMDREAAAGAYYTSDFPGREAKSGVEALQLVDDAYDFENHFVVIDLSMAKAKAPETEGAREGSLSSAAMDVFHVMRSIRQSYPQNDIVLLTKDTSFSAYFGRYWNSVPGAIPVKYIDGCGLNANDLRRCNLKRSAGIIIFFSGDIGGASTGGLSLLVFLSVASILPSSHNIPVVVELDSTQYLSLFPPYADDPYLCSRAESDFVFEPNYVIGNALSRHMFFPSVHRTYFMDEFVDIIDMMVSGVDERTPSLGRLPLLFTTDSLHIYQDVVEYCLKLCYLPIGLHRCISDPETPYINGQRFVLTNPPGDLIVDQKCDAVFYLLPAS